MERPSPVALSKSDPWLVDQLALEATPARRISVSEKLSRPSSVLSSTISAVAKFRGRGAPASLLSQLRGNVFIYLPIGMRVSPTSADRALRLLDTLIKACEARKLRVFIENKHIRVGFGEHSARVRISERVDKKHGSIKGMSNIDVLLGKSITYLPTGELTIFIERLSSERKVADKSDSALEGQMNSVMEAIFRAIAETKAQREFYEARATSDARTRQMAMEAAAEIERTQREAEKRRLDLISETNAWHQAVAIRRYVEAVSSRVDSPSLALQDWLGWASGIADEIDPISNRADQEAT